MTTELEKQFFDTFKISKRKICNYHNCKCPLFDTSNIKSACPKQKALQETPTGYGTTNCSLIMEEYPQITDRQLLELLCILSKQIAKKHKGKWYEIYAYDNYEFLKETILNDCRLAGKEIKHQVQAIFEGER